MKIESIYKIVFLTSLAISCIVYPKIYYFRKYCEENGFLLLDHLGSLKIMIFYSILSIVILIYLDF